MNKKQAAEIDALLEQHDTRTGKRGDDARDEENFAVEFGRLRDEVIKPAMEEVVVKLKVSGHDATIRETKLTEAKTDKDQPGAIRLEILPAGAKRARYKKDDVPGVTFAAEPGMRVGVHSRSGQPDETSSSGPMRRFRLSEVTSEMVIAEILEVLRKTL